jgi:protein tyrosine/serine phosphatase
VYGDTGAPAEQGIGSNLMADETRWVRLDGAVNVRDLGGLATTDGGTTAPGRAYRADNLQELTPADVRVLVDRLGVRTVVDLRTSVEVEKEGPGPLTREPSVVHRHCSLFPEGGRMTDIDADTLLPWQTGDRETDAADEELSPSVRFYLGYLRDRPDSVAAALRALAEPDSGGTAIVHCAAGKDRTGVVVALALTAADVTREAIISDYVATGEVLDAILDRLRRSPTYAADLDDRPAETHRPRAATMQRLLEILDERYGGPLAWLEKAGFGSDDVAALRARLRD